MLFHMNLIFVYSVSLVCVQRAFECTCGTHFTRFVMRSVCEPVDGKGEPLWTHKFNRCKYLTFIFYMQMYSPTKSLFPNRAIQVIESSFLCFYIAICFRKTKYHIVRFFPVLCSPCENLNQFSWLYECAFHLCVDRYPSWQSSVGHPVFGSGTSCFSGGQRAQGDPTNLPQRAHHHTTSGTHISVFSPHSFPFMIITYYNCAGHGLIYVMSQAVSFCFFLFLNNKKMVYVGSAVNALVCFMN